MTPDDELAALIANRLAAGGLIDAARTDEVAARIAAGAATPEDWRLWIELGPGGRGDDGEGGGGDDAPD